MERLKEEGWITSICYDDEVRLLCNAQESTV